MWRVIGTGLCVVLIAACGGGSSSKSGAPAASTTTTTLASPETEAWVAAAALGLSTGDSAPKGITSADATCLARALINNVTVERLKNAGAVIEDLSDPNKDLPSSLAATVPAASKLAMGQAMQSCGFGRLVGSLLADGIAEGIGGGYQPDTEARQCVAEWFDAPAQQKLISDIVLSTDPTPTEAKSFAQVFVDCLDVATMMAPAMHLTLTDAEKTCINTEARADDQFVNAIAGEIAGTGSASKSNLDLFGARTVKCLTPEHLLQISNANN
jgi:hypothetical protein